MTAREKLKNFFTPERSRKIAKTAGICVAVAAVIVILSLSIYSIAAYAPLRANIDLDAERQTMGGFGASSAWIYQELGVPELEETADRAIKMLYGDSGLQLDIFRYNIGGGSADEALDDTWPYNNAGFDQGRRAESFFIAENYDDPSDFLDTANYDFDGRDTAVQSMFATALDTGNINKVVFFSNSPHYLMTESGVCTGAYEYQNNLKPEYYEEYSEYMLICVKGLYDKYLADMPDVEVWISPVNEPQWKWGGDGSSQEGCHYDADVLAAFYEVFWDKLNEFNEQNGTDFKMDAFESGNYKFYLFDDDIRDYLEEMSKYEYFSELDEISVHAYGAEDSKSHRSKFAAFMEENYPELKVASTEFCELEWGEFDTIESGMYLAKVVLRDLTMIDATEWSWWLSVAKGGYNDGLVYWDSDGTRESDLWVLKRYYTFGQITRFIDKGDVRVESPLSDLTGWAGVDIGVFKKPDGRVVVVVINDGAAKDLRLNGMERFAGTEVAVTTTTQDKNWEESAFVFSDHVSLEENSVTTFVFGG